MPGPYSGGGWFSGRIRGGVTAGFSVDGAGVSAGVAGFSVGVAGGAASGVGAGVGAGVAAGGSAGRAGSGAPPHPAAINAIAHTKPAIHLVIAETPCRYKLQATGYQLPARMKHPSMGISRYRYLHYDVFTDRRFGGNQLAVFPEAAGLSAQTMQQIAREIGFAETTFVTQAERPDTDVRMRIFTPGTEMPMAGHPVVGSTFALARDGAIAAGRSDWVFGLNIGPIPVSMEWSGSRLDFAWMTQRNPRVRPDVRRCGARRGGVGSG